MIISKTASTRKSFAGIFSTQVTLGEYFHFDEVDPQSTDIEIMFGGLEKCSPDYVVKRSRFNYYAIEYILSGNCTLTLGGKTYPLTSGHVFCYGPHVPHKIESTGDAPLIKYFVDFSGRQVPDLLWNIFLKENKPCRLNNIKWLSDTFQQMLQCGKRDDHHARPLCKLLLKYLIQRIESDRIIDSKPLSPARCSYERSRKFIENNFIKIRRMGEVAKACHLSLPHLCRLFKRYSKESPNQMLIRLKLERAVELIADGNYLIKEIADEVGFDDPFYFSYRFKQHFGTSPSHFAQRADSKLEVMSELKGIEGAMSV